MFWKPKTRVEWLLVIGVVAITIVWAALRGHWASPIGFMHSFRLNPNIDDRAGGIATFPPKDLFFMIPLWCFYGFLRARVRKQHPGVG